VIQKIIEMIVKAKGGDDRQKLMAGSGLSKDRGNYYFSKCDLIT
jgi:hypothetical protein